MPRPKSQSDEAVLEAVIALLRSSGPAAITFRKVAGATGLAPATLVQRFGTLALLKQAALAKAWASLEAETERAFDAAKRSPAGAIEALCRLSDPGPSSVEADDLTLLREDLRDPRLRERALQWRSRLLDQLIRCFGAAAEPRLIAEDMFVYWQGLILTGLFGAPDRKTCGDRLSQWFERYSRGVKQDPA